MSNFILDIMGKPIKRNMRIMLVLVVFFALIVATACSTEEPEPESEIEVTVEVPETPLEAEPEDEPEEEAVPEPTPEPVHGEITGIESINPLTGAPMDLGKIRNRPLAIVLVNQEDALPLNGISEADIIYEYLVEGGITRFLALFQDFSHVTKVGCIRSVRHYTVELAESYDAILFSAGGSPQALRYVRTAGVPHLNEVEGPRREVFYRDRFRIGGRRLESLHSVVTTNERVIEWLPKYDFRLEHEDDYEHVLSFVEDGTPQGGSDATDVVVRFSAGKTTRFIYNSGGNTYRMNQFGIDFIDANNNVRPEFTNVLIITTSVGGLRGDTAGRRNVVTIGEGEGYFVNGGKYIEIDWSREDATSQFVYTLKDGSELELGIGNTFICIIPTNMEATFS